jgi:uncharacterized RDD family membrane protein YckC
MIYDLQKASVMKRFMAFLLDFILVIILITGFMWIFSAISGYDSYSNKLSSQMAEIEQKHGIPEITKEYEIDIDRYASLSEDERNKYPETVRTSLENCIKEINSNLEISQTYIMIMSLTITSISISIFFSVLIAEFIIPLFLKNGQTVGKKIFSIAVMRIDGVKVTPVIMFVRSILGKYTVEIMIPVIILLMAFFGVASIVTLGVVALIVLFEIGLVIFTKTNSLIHDVLSSTVTVDLASQMIFDSPEAKQEYQLRIHQEDAKNANY